MEYVNHLYQILYPNRALVASQLNPEQFGKHYQFGSSRYYAGKLIFSEIDINYRHEYFDIETALNEMAPHSDGRPKATKYICSYRVFEHIDPDAIQSLFIANSNGSLLELKQAPYEKKHKPGFIRTFANICPLTMLVLSTYNAAEYAKYTTAPKKSKGAPQLLFTQIELDTEKFLKDFENNPFMAAPIPFLHPSKLRDSIIEILRSHGKKPVKGISLSSDMGKIPYTSLRHGFWISSAEKICYFPMPDIHEIEQTNYEFYKAMN